MIRPQPVHAFRANVEALRLKTVEELAAKENAATIDDLIDLAAIQAALTAVREEIEPLGGKPGWGTTPELDQRAGSAAHMKTARRYIRGEPFSFVSIGWEESDPPPVDNYSTRRASNRGLSPITLIGLDR